LPCLYDDCLVFAADLNCAASSDDNHFGGRNCLKAELCAHCRSSDHRRCHNIAVALCQFFVDHVIDAPAQHKQLNLCHVHNFVQFVDDDMRISSDLSCLRGEKINRGSATCGENLVALAYAEWLAVAVGSIGVVGSMQDRNLASSGDCGRCERLRRQLRKHEHEQKQRNGSCAC
jgi:hypothetical protein